MAKFLDYLAEPRHKFFEEKNALEAYQLMRPFLWKRGMGEVERRATLELGGLILRDLKRFDEAFKLYKEIGDDYQAGYCLMLSGKMKDVRPYWTRLAEKRPNHWCASLYGMITHQVTVYPTLLQIRNYLESDVVNLIQAGQIPYLENILIYAEFLAQLNMEAYKFLGRSLMHAGWLDKAEDYLLRGQKVLPNDPEIYFHLGQYTFARNLYKDSRLMLNQCLLISPTYTPARDLLNQIAS